MDCARHGAKRFLSFIVMSASLSLATPVRAELSVSLFPGASVLLDQDVKVREFNSAGDETSRKFPGHASSAIGPIYGVKTSYFFHRNFGIESEIFYNRVAIDADITGTRFTQTEIAQNRVVFLPSLVARARINRTKNISVYGGLGYGWVYSDVSMIGKEWGLGGQMFAGISFPINARYSIFLESKYFWAPDVGSENISPGEQLKISGNGSNNLAKRVFGPHTDTQIIGFLIGFRFMIMP